MKFILSYTFIAVLAITFLTLSNYYKFDIDLSNIYFLLSLICFAPLLPMFILAMTDFDIPNKYSEWYEYFFFYFPNLLYFSVLILTYFQFKLEGWK